MRRPVRFVLACALLAAAPLAAAGGVVKWIDKSGVTHYSNVPGDRGEGALRVAAGNASTAITTRASIYKFRDAGGVTHYTDRKPHNRNYVVISMYCPACDPTSPVNWHKTRLNLTAYASEINDAATRFGVDPALVRAIMHAESSFNPEARSRKGAQGLMQLMPATAASYGVADAFDARANIEGGVQHLAGLLRDFNGDLELVAAAYNAGAGAVRKYGGVPPYDETKVYVERVGILAERYKSGLSQAAGVAAPAM
jgi:membrane-bound lytic murein transglycosylase B